ncbi:MAG: asparagine synthase (glutamine-hydrolyzing) [Elusimicrobiales bacterium]|nr:asparagine synthase (glutamine-hydrolyzing) [Elusimicrobiales bacterium]
MCGILGKINYASKKPVAEAELKRPLFEMFHRGPDDEGLLVDRHCGLGMRRLKIIDLEGGRQPVYSEDGALAVFLNGEIYNYRELRRELEPRHKFKTNSDTEVIVHLYEELGEACLQKLNGMFALAVWDARREELFLARDRAGIKPLFYADLNGSLYFASELRSLLAFPGMPRELDREALTDYLSFYYISSPRSIFKHIRRLPQGHCLKAGAGRAEVRPYWNYAFKPAKMSAADAAARVEAALLNSVRRQLVSDVPLGVFLSSGLDSTAIVAMMAKLGVRAKTYTIGYDGGGTFNELAGARLVAQKYRTEHHDCLFGPDDVIKDLPAAVSRFAEPHGDWTYLAMGRLSAQSRPDITVALTGAGGDELFGGYPTLIAAKFGRYYRFLPGPVKTALRAAADRLPVSTERLSLDFKIKSFARGAAFQPELAHLKYKEILTPEEINAFLPGGPAGDTFGVFAQHLPQVAGRPLLDRLLYLDLNVFLPYCSLHATDLVTMMNSQEARVPLLDNEMLDLSAEVPLALKLSGFSTKHVMRLALRKYLPEEIVKMPKRGFVMPTAAWLKGGLRPFALDAIGAARAKFPGAYNYAFAEKLLEDHCAGRADNARKLACLVSLFLWQAEYGS